MNLTRRALLLQSTAFSLLAAGYRHRYCICNETFAGKSFAESCELAKAAGFEAVEIAPATLKVGPAAARRAMQDAGLQYAGLHSLVSAPPGLHLTTPDNAVRTRSWEFFRKLVDLSGDLSGGAPSVMVLGSGKQRGTVGGSTVADARNRLRDGLAATAAHAQERRVSLLLEPLSPEFTDVVNTLGEAVAMVREIGSPAVSSMFDTHNTVAETEPHDQLIWKHAKHIRHVHFNELDGRHPGTGKYDFALVLKALRSIDFQGWVSLEVFRFEPSGEQIAKETMAYLRTLERERQ
jgi:sugar phosphate isomerase/epimerase